jgi:hypothetical protein
MIDLRMFLSRPLPNFIQRLLPFAFPGRQIFVVKLVAHSK